MKSSATESIFAGGVEVGVDRLSDLLIPFVCSKDFGSQYGSED